MDRNSHINFGILPNRPKIVYVLIIIPEEFQEAGSKAEGEALPPGMQSRGTLHARKCMGFSHNPLRVTPGGIFVSFRYRFDSSLSSIGFA